MNGLPQKVFAKRSINTSLIHLDSILALYIFEALNGKPVGDGKPVKHPVSYQDICFQEFVVLFEL